MRKVLLNTPHPYPRQAYLVDRPSDIPQALSSLELGSGPLAVDTERASTYTYDDRAHLIQVYRTDSEIFLLDPDRLGENIKNFQPLFNSLEWILHAADSDLPAMATAGFYPVRVWDTLLAAEILGLDTLNLAALTDRLLGIYLEKGHGDEDWSHRPFETDWLEYAALDVVYLPDIVDILSQQLQQENRFEWWVEECEYCVSTSAHALAEPVFENLKGLNKLKGGLRLKVASDLWSVRNEWAAALDLPPDVVLPSNQIIQAAQQAPQKPLSKNKVRKHSPYFRGYRGESIDKDLLKELTDTYLSAVSSDSTQDRQAREEILRSVAEHQSNNTGLSYPSQRQWTERYPRLQASFKDAHEALEDLNSELGIRLSLIVKTRELRYILWKLYKARVRAHEDLVRALPGILETTQLRDWQKTIVSDVLAQVFKR